LEPTTEYQHEIVRHTIWRRFDIAICPCTVCHQRVQGRHLLQTSDALGAAAVQLGREAARRSLVNGIDETGWRVEAQLRWIGAATSSANTTCNGSSTMGVF
jgi:hypothetical protein